MDNSEQVACLRTKHPKRRKKRRHRHELHQFLTNGFIRFVKIRVIRVSNSLARGGLPAFAMGSSRQLWRLKTVKQAADDLDMGPTKHPPSSQLLRGRREMMPRFLQILTMSGSQRCPETAGLRDKKTTQRPKLPDAVSRAFDASILQVTAVIPRDCQSALVFRELLLEQPLVFLVQLNGRVVDHITRISIRYCGCSD